MASKMLKEDISCYFSVTNSEPVIYEGDYSFEDMQKMLKEMGISLEIIQNKDISNPLLFLRFHRQEYNRNKTRYAGGQRKYGYVDEYQHETCKYYDILYFRYGKKWKEKDIYKYIGLSKATYFRHKQEMEQSYFYKKFLTKFEPEKADSLEYFQSFPELDVFF